MKHLFSILLLIFITISSFAQFNDTAALNAYIRDTITDRRPNKITAAQLQKGLQGIVKFIPFTTPLNSKQIAYGSSNNILTGKSAFTFNDTTNTLQTDSLLGKKLIVTDPMVNSTDYTRIIPNSISINNALGAPGGGILSLTTNGEGFQRINFRNTNSDVSAGAGALYMNDVGSFLQYYVGSNVNGFVPNGVLIRSTGSGGFNIAADAGPIAFGKSAWMGAAEFARFTTDGKLGIGLTNPTATLHLKAGTATAGTAPIKLTPGTVLTTPEGGAIEYDGRGFFITDSSGVRHDMTQTDRLYKIYSRDYNGNANYTYTLIGWDASYTSDIDNAHTVTSTIDVEITVPSGTPAGTQVAVLLSSDTVYTLTVTGTTTGPDRYVIGTIVVNQDIKYPGVYYVKGAIETINSTGLVTTTNAAFRLDYPQTFTNPDLKFATTGSTLIRIGATYTVDKKQQGHWIL